MKSFIRKVRYFTSVQKGNLKKLFKKIENKEIKEGYAYNIISNRLVKKSGRTYKKLNKSNPAFFTVNKNLNSLLNMNNTGLKKIQNTIFGGSNTSYTIMLYRMVDNPRKHAINEFDHKGLRLATVSTINGVVLKKTTARFRSKLDEFINLDSKTFDKFIYPILMKNNTMLEEMNRPTWDYNDYIKIIYNGSYDEKKLTNYEVSQIQLKDNTTNKAISYKYLKYDINQDAKTFGELFNQKKLHDRSNSCMLNEIMNTYEKYFEKSRYKNLTYNALCNLVGKKERKKDNVVKIDEIKTFFKKYKLGLIVYDSMYNIVYNYKPEKYNTNIKPKNMRILVHNNHCYLLNNNIKELEHKNKEVEYIKSKLSVGSKYKFRSIDENKTHTFKFINNLNDIVEHIKTTKDKMIKYFYRGDLRELLITMMKIHRYEPRVFFQHNRVLSLEFRIADKLCVISHPDYDNMDDIMTYDVNENNYMKFKKADDDFYSKIVKKEHMSMFNDDALKINEEYPKCASVFKTDDLLSGNGIDINKCYSWAMRSIKQIPIFNYFDNYLKYDNHIIEDYNMYVIQSYDTSPESIILAPKKYNRIYGFKLKQMKKDDYEILYYIRPSNIANVDFNKAVDDLYNTDLNNINVNKYICNKITGMLEKKYNHKSVSKLYTNIDEANHYKNLYGGEINAISDDLYLLVRDTKKLVRETFRPIKDMIYDMVSIKMYNLYNKCVAKGLKPVCVKTDCIIVDNSIEEIKKYFNFDNMIGGFKLEKNSKVKGYYPIQVENELLELHKTNINNISITNEWNTEEITNVFDKYDRILINATLPGSGKSHSVKNYKNKKILFVAPFNKLCQSIRDDGHDAITFHKLLGLNVMNNECEFIKKYNTQSYDVICFDEIYMYSLNQLTRIKLFMNARKDKKFIATGDLCQLDPIQNEYLFNNIKNIDHKTTHAINSMFNNIITLKICKRVKTEQERHILSKIKEEIFDENNKPFDILQKYFKVVDNMKDVKTINNITYYNFRCLRVAKHIHNKQRIPRNYKVVDGIVYYKGMNLICKKYNRSPKIYVNYSYEIIKTGKKNFIIKDVCENNTIIIPIEMISKHFRLSYASTCHSFQGLSVDNMITIFDTNTPRVTRKWIWTAITRSTDLSKIQIYKHSDNEVSKLKDSMIKQQMKNKKENYKSFGTNIDKNTYPLFGIYTPKNIDYDNTFSDDEDDQKYSFL